jgi:hypothetical protein
MQAHVQVRRAANQGLIFPCTNTELCRYRAIQLGKPPQEAQKTGIQLVTVTSWKPNSYEVVVEDDAS